jgi:hypothetical protein
MVRERTSVGPELAIRSYPLSREGPMFGLDASLLDNEVGSFNQWRANFVVGYSKLPARYEGPFGIEVDAVAGGGRAAVGNEIPYLLGFGGRLAVPIRLSARREPWDADTLLGTTFHLVPDVSVMELFPLDGPQRDVRHEVAVGLALRVHLWTGLQP